MVGFQTHMSGALRGGKPIFFKREIEKEREGDGKRERAAEPGKKEKGRKTIHIHSSGTISFPELSLRIENTKLSLKGICRTCNFVLSDPDQTQGRIWINIEY